MYSIGIQELVKSNVTINQEYKMKGTLVFLHFIFFDFNIDEPSDSFGNIISTS